MSAAKAKKVPTPSQQTFLDLVKIHRTSDWLREIEGQEFRTMVYTMQALGISPNYMICHVRLNVNDQPHSSATLRAMEIDGELVDTHGNIGSRAIHGNFRKESLKAQNDPLAKGSVESRPWSPIEVGRLDLSQPNLPASGATKEEFKRYVEIGIARLNALRIEDSTVPPSAQPRQSPRL